MKEFLCKKLTEDELLEVTQRACNDCMDICMSFDPDEKDRVLLACMLVCQVLASRMEGGVQKIRDAGDIAAVANAALNDLFDMYEKAEGN